MKEKILIVEDAFVEADYLRGLMEQAGYAVTGIAPSVARARGMIEQERPGFVLLDIFLKGKETGIDLAQWLAKENIPFVYISANSAGDVLAAAKTTQPYGFLIKPFREMDLIATLEIARYRHEQSVQYKEGRAATLMNELKGLASEPLEWQPKLMKVGMLLQRCIPFDYIAMGFGEPGSEGISFLRIGFNEYQTIGVKELQVISRKSWGDISFERLIADTFQMRSDLVIPLELANKRTIPLRLFSRRPDVYNPDHLAIIERALPVLEEVVAEAMDRSDGVVAAGGGDKVSAPGQSFEGIVGKSHLLLNVFDLISQVAFADTSVLILGESGTGKERIADSIHQQSRRSGRPFVKINCAALPASLIETELFGHEKGAFTGALERRIGKFEKAHKGTIFLDEIGEMPMELQVKLLRVLQEKEIERVGGKDPIKVDVRIVAATNKNLEKEVAEGRFRLDLYYRLNVYPILSPPLRERKEDIPLLAGHFIRLYNQKAGKKVVGVSEKVMQLMMQYHWPGNIRELEHLMERSVLLARGPMIESILLPTFASTPAADASDNRLKTSEENERDHILAVLKKCNGKIWGPGAAAEILNLPPSTLKSRMKKLGIKKEYLP